MAVANHEGGKIEFTGTNENGTPHPPVVGEDIHDIAWQSATITARTNTDPIQAIGVRGIAAITDLIGTVEASLSGIVTYEPNHANYPLAGADGLLDKTLGDFVSQFGNIVCETRGEDVTDTGQKVTCLNMFLTGVSVSVEQNSSVTADWSFVGYDNTWEDSDFDFGDPNDLEIGTGCNFVPLSSKDIEMIVTANHADGFASAGFELQSISIQATINRTEIYVIGEQAPIDRPVTLPFDVTVNAESLADGGQLIRNFKPTYVWNAGPGKCDNNSFDVVVRHKTDLQNICGAKNLRPVDGSLSVSVGNNSTTSMSFSGWDMDL